MRLILLLVLIGTLTSQWLSAQVVAGQDSSVTNDAVEYAPLLLFTNGVGKTVPFQDGQMLEVGRDYTLAAVAAPGFTFTYWRPVYVFTFVERVYDLSGVTHTNTSTVISLQPDFTPRPAIRVTMQPVEVLYNSASITVTESRGWQANFAPTQ